MKKLVALTLVLLTLTCSLVACSPKEEDNFYTLGDCEVYDVGKYPNEIAIIDLTDDIWVFHQEDISDIKIGDDCELVMDNKGTPEYLYDDEIVEIHWFE